MVKQLFIQRARYLHRLLLWPALLAMVIFVLSGFMHILLTWTGPQTIVTKAPLQKIAVGTLQALPAVLKKHQIHEAEIIKLVPSARGSLLQVTENRQLPRRYFDLQSGEELPGYDEEQARWLANYYQASPPHDNARVIQSISFQTEFDDNYPWVNRLLPVYKVVYAGEDGLTLYVHTETLALANISNNWKRRLQTIFRQVHTWQWLQQFPQARVLVMLLLLSSLFVMAVMGITLLSLLRRRQVQESSRRWHRVLASVVCIPLLGFVASGSYHLLQGEYGETVRDFNLSRPLLLQSAYFDGALPASAFDNSAGQALNSVALINIGNQLYYRSSLANGTNATGSGEHDHHGAHQVRQQRFEGISAEQGSRYVALAAGHPVSPLDDAAVARLLAMDYQSLAAEQIIAVEKISRFGPEYDFRNKRLPVWRVATAQQDILFIDVASGLLVDKMSPTTRLESYSFSLLHKWNFLTALTGREARDVLIVLVLGLALLLAALGLLLRLKSRPEAV